MGQRAHIGFTVTKVKRLDGGKKCVLIWAATGTQAITEEDLEMDSDHILESSEEDNKFVHWTEVFK